MGEDYRAQLDRYRNIIGAAVEDVQRQLEVLELENRHLFDLIARWKVEADACAQMGEDTEKERREALVQQAVQRRKELDKQLDFTARLLHSLKSAQQAAARLERPPIWFTGLS